MLDTQWQKEPEYTAEEVKSAILCFVFSSFLVPPPPSLIIKACHILYGWPYCNDAKEGVGAITPPKLNRG